MKKYLQSKRGRKGIDINIIIDLYNKGYNISEIAEQCNCDRTNVARRLKKSGINYVRDYSKIRRNKSNCIKVDIDFFKNIDSEEKAYFLGLMFSDGSVSKNQFYLKLKDEDVILKFKKALKSEHNIMHRLRPESFTLEVSRQEMCNDLISLGCIPNKTRTLRFPNIKPELLNHFIRGYMDGDGCIRVGMTSGKDCFDIASASYNFILDLKLVLEPHIKHIGIDKETKCDVWHLRCGGKQVKPLLNWIYKDSTVYMQRKYFKYQLISSR